MLGVVAFGCFVESVGPLFNKRDDPHRMIMSVTFPFPIAATKTATPTPGMVAAASSSLSFPSAPVCLR